MFIAPWDLKDFENGHMTPLERTVPSESEDGSSSNPPRFYLRRISNRS